MTLKEVFESLDLTGYVLDLSYVHMILTPPFANNSYSSQV
jgi:hypothetical protein